MASSPTNSLVSLSNELAALVETSAALDSRRAWPPTLQFERRPLVAGGRITAEHTLRHDDGVVATTGAGDRFRRRSRWPRPWH